MGLVCGRFAGLCGDVRLDCGGARLETGLLGSYIYWLPLKPRHHSCCSLHSINMDQNLGLVLLQHQNNVMGVAGHRLLLREWVGTQPGLRGGCMGPPAVLLKLLLPLLLQPLPKGTTHHRLTPCTLLSVLPELDFDRLFFVRPLAAQLHLEALWASLARVRPKRAALKELVRP